MKNKEVDWSTNKGLKIPIKMKNKKTNKEIIIEGDFTVKGDLYGLDKMCKRFKSMKIKLREIPNAYIDSFEGIKK